MKAVEIRHAAWHIGRAVVVMVIAALVVIEVLKRTDEGTIAQIAGQPYAQLEILPDSIYQSSASTEGGGVAHRLYFAVKITDKRTTCEQVQITIRLQMLGAELPLVSRIYPARQVASPGTPTIADNIAIPLKEPLALGKYILNFDSRCFVMREGTLSPFGAAASAQPQCFEVRSERLRFDTVEMTAPIACPVPPALRQAGEATSGL